MGLKKGKKVDKKEDLLESFPIRDNVDCYLSGIKYFSSNGYTGVQVSFKREGKFFNHSWYQPKEGSDNFKKDLFNFRKSVENLLSLFLNGNEMVTLLNESTSLEDYINNANKLLKNKKVWQIKLEIKTLVNNKKKIILPRYPEYVKLFGSTKRDIKYTTWEKNYNRENLYYKF